MESKMSTDGEITETVISDEYQVVEVSSDGNDIGPLSSGHFEIGSDDDDLITRELAVAYAKRVTKAMADAPCKTAYVVRRVTVTAVSF